MSEAAGDAPSRESTDPPADAGRHTATGPWDRFPGDPATRGVVVVTVVSLLLRLVDLGGRVFHWDEGRVGYWILRFDATGEFFYRPIIHGPFLPVVNNALFDVLGASDFTARLPVALVGGLLPLAALCFRRRLSTREQVALALVLALDPLLVYYSRFMRSDVLVGAFAFGAFALVVYAVDHERTLPLVPAAALLALGFASKENALVYVACFAGAAALVVDHRVVRGSTRSGSLLDAVVREGVSLARFAGRWTGGRRTRRAIERRVAERGGRSAPFAPEIGALGHLLVWVPLVTAAILGTFLAVVAFFYAPRPELWGALGGVDPVQPVLYNATVVPGERLYGTWAAGSHSGHSYAPYLLDLAETLVYGSGVVLVLAALGFLADGYGGRNRSLVAFAVYWAAASLVGYPVATDIQAPWAAVHVVLPLAIPAAVGIATVADSFEESLAAEDVASLALAGLLVFAAVGGVAAANVDYWNSTDREDEQVLQWAQPGNEIRPALDDARLVAEHNDGTDVMFVGTYVGDSTEFYLNDESSVERMPPGGPGWHDRLPLPWYLELSEAETTSTHPDARYDGLPDDPPPVIVAMSDDREGLMERYDGYEARTYPFKLWGEDVTFLFDEEALAEARAAETGEPGTEGA
ncbi:flippase activity-associated protein Agl23 [Halorarum salinum]|uniref:TIGR03663 family protein n=1 Tax=Halorarum salinum TaxID=2743089 RepID=A0A7D5LA05_9EURY|nr:flippase activity-associated protein Agl23 [Halobaculum salinum]QLG61612.1 TIGR03663 family protein [Halobaculum salinum]